MNKANNNGLKKAEAKVETILEQATRLPLAIRRSIVLGVLALVLLLIALVIAGIASCSGNSSREALVQETPAPLNDGEAGGAPAASATAAAESVSGYVQPQTTAGEDGVTTLEDEEDPSRQQEGDEAFPEDTSLPIEDTPAPTDAPTPEPTSQYTTLKKHDKSEEVTQLQNRLMELGYLEIDEPTDYFGSSTAYAVQLFQRQHNLTQDGVAGPTTQTLLYSKDAEKYCLKEGAEGRDVKQLQQQLCELGYLDEKEIDHVYGPTTISAIKTFQKRNKLTDDGMAGEKTLEKLYSDDARISSSLQKAQASASAAAAQARSWFSGEPETAQPPKTDGFVLPILLEKQYSALFTTLLKAPVKTITAGKPRPEYSAYPPVSTQIDAKNFRQEKKHTYSPQTQNRCLP